MHKYPHKKNVNTDKMDEPEEQPKGQDGRGIAVEGQQLVASKPVVAVASASGAALFPIDSPAISTEIEGVGFRVCRRGGKKGKGLEVGKNTTTRRKKGLQMGRYKFTESDVFIEGYHWLRYPPLHTSPYRISQIESHS